MTLPVATNTQDGSLSPASAAIKGCLVTQPVSDGTAGSTAKPPAVDTSVCSKAVYSATTLGFTLDLAPFVLRWSAGTPNNGIALVPDLTKAGPTTVWHVTLNGRQRANAKHVSSQLTY